MQQIGAYGLLKGIVLVPQILFNPFVFWAGSLFYEHSLLVVPDFASPLSFAYPMLSISYVLINSISHSIHEPISVLNWWASPLSWWEFA